jgi:hypothetical protein
MERVWSGHKRVMLGRAWSDGLFILSIESNWPTVNEPCMCHQMGLCVSPSMNHDGPRATLSMVTIASHQCLCHAKMVVPRADPYNPTHLATYRFVCIVVFIPFFPVFFIFVLYL